MQHAFIFFTENRPPRGRSVAWAWSAYLAALSAPFLHVAIGDPETGVILSPHPGGHRRWALSDYGNEYPRLVCAFDVPLSSLDLSAIEDHHYGPAGSIVRLLTGGHYNPPDCIGIALSVLRRGGWHVPPMPTPKHLHHWLYRRGFKHVTF